METPNDDKRSQHRVEAAIAIRVHGVDSAGHTYDDFTTALEVSRRGLSFLTKHKLEVPANLTVLIPGRGPVRAGDGPTDFFTEATVVRSIKEDENFFRVAVRFMGATLTMYCSEGS
jgi:hypothetical protein